jgi:hypothetical protein
MKVRVSYERKQFRDARVEVNEDDLLAYVNEVGSDYFKSLDEVKAEDGEDFEYLLREFLEQRDLLDPIDRDQMHVETGPDELEVITVEEVDE